MITFRCIRCTDLIRAEDHSSGHPVTCRACGHPNRCPETSLVPTRLAAPPERRSGRVVGLLAGTAVLAAIGWAAWSTFGPFDASAAAAKALPPAEAMQQQLLHKDINTPGDPLLNRQFGEINAKHFSGTLPVLQVLWEPGLAAVGQLATPPFTLEGMFGHVGRRSVILLNPGLQGDASALRRALCHEMVHAYLYSTGDTTSNHGPAFQAALQRLSEERAFEGIAASDDDRRALKAWLDTESARLDDERGQIDRVTVDIEHERAEVEQALADLNARVEAANAARRGWPTKHEIAAVEAQRDAYNQKAADANERAARDRADLDHFNKEVDRYNLMLAYPDGLDEEAVVQPKGRTGVRR